MTSKHLTSSMTDNGQRQWLFSSLFAPALFVFSVCLTVTIGCQTREEQGVVSSSGSSGGGMNDPDSDSAVKQTGKLPETTPDSDSVSRGVAATVTQSAQDAAGEAAQDAAGEAAPDAAGEAGVVSGGGTPTVEQLREAALQALGEGQDDTAFQFARQAMSRAPGNPQVVFLFAMVLADRHRYAEAIHILNELSDREPATRLPALGQTAEWLVESGHYAEAEQQFRTILKEIPDALMVHHRLAQLLLQTGRRTEAALHFDYLAQFGELDHEELRALLIRHQAFPGDDGVTRFDPLNNLAMCRQEIADGKVQEVINVIDAAGEKNSDGELELLHRLRAQQGDFDDVQKWVAKLDMTNSGPDAWFARGCLALDRNSFAEAIACFSRVLLLDPTDAEAYRRLSEALKSTGDVEKAKAIAARADLVAETHKLGRELIGEKANDRVLIDRLVELLMQLKRPMEAFGWQTIGLVHAVEAAAITETQAQATFESIGRQRDQFVNSGQHRADPAFVLCGLGPEVFNPVMEKSDQ